MNKFILVVLTVLVSQVSVAANVETCGQMTSPVPYSYCITKTEGSTSSGVLYYLHGGGGNEKQWGEISPAIYSDWQNRNVDAPVVISVTFGEYWLLVEPNASPNSGLLDVFEHAVVPQMEMLALGKLADDRALMGLSMGGFNSAKLLARAPMHTFDRAVLVCPAIVELSPYATKEEIVDYVSKHPGTSAKSLENLAFIAQAFVPDSTTWDTSANPLVLTDKIAASQTQMFIATNVDDATFAPGGVVFANKVSLLAPNTIVQQWSGGHCDLDDSAIAAFLIP